MSKINVQNKIKSNFNYLEQLIKYADNHNIKVILVSTPTTNLYKNYVTSTAQYFNLVRNTRKLKNKYKNVIWLNYLENNEDFNNTATTEAKQSISVIIKTAKPFQIVAHIFLLFTTSLTGSGSSFSLFKNKATCTPVTRSPKLKK